MAKILGFVCYIAEPRVRSAIEHVLTQIENVRPEDFKRLQSKVLGFRWLPQEDVRDQRCAIGQWVNDVKARQSKAFRAETEKRVRDMAARLSGVKPQEVHREWVEVHVVHELQSNEFEWPGTVALSRRITTVDRDHLVATIAHELGHAATTESDFDNRFEISRIAEWTSESCADYYAYRWGFGRLIRKHSKIRDLAHHGGLPGDEITLGEGKYKVTRHFYYRPIE